MFRTTSFVLDLKLRLFGWIVNITILPARRE